MLKVNETSELYIGLLVQERDVGYIMSVYRQRQPEVLQLLLLVSNLIYYFFQRLKRVTFEFGNNLFLRINQTQLVVLFCVTFYVREGAKLFATECSIGAA